MGTHAWFYIEWRDANSPQWLPSNESNLNLHRDYRVYDALAGGRNGGGYLYEHRGLPDDVSVGVLKRACYRIADSDQEASKSRWPEFVVKRRPGIEPPHFRVICRDGAEYFHETNGYMHSHTWMSPNEVENSLRSARIERDDLSQDWISMLDQMRALERSGKEVRLVMWFGDGPIPEKLRRPHPPR